MNKTNDPEASKDVGITGSALPFAMNKNDPEATKGAGITGSRLPLAMNETPQKRPKMLASPAQDCLWP